MVESLNSLFTFRGFHCVLILSLYHFAKDSPTQIKLGSDVMIKVTNPIFKQQFLYCSSLCLRLTTLRFKTKRHGLETVGRVSISSVLKRKRLRTQVSLYGSSTSSLSLLTVRCLDSEPRLNTRK